MAKNEYPHLNMATVDVEIPQAEYEILQQIAEKLGLLDSDNYPCVRVLIQQEIDHALTSISAWLQRAELLNLHTE